MIRFVFLDLDDTLLDFRAAEVRAITLALKGEGIEPTPAVVELYHNINRRQWELLEQGEITRSQVLTRRFELLFAELGIDRPIASIKTAYETFLGQGHIFINGAETLLETLYPRYQLYLASNGNLRIQKGRLDSAGIRKYFQKIFVSEEVGANKPSLAFFDACFAAIPDFDPTQAIIVGDSLTSDIQGGIHAGIRTCWFNPHSNPGRADIHPDHEITALSELPSLLERL